MTIWEAIIARDAAGLEAVHGDLEQALALFDTAIDSLHRAGNVGQLAFALADLAVFFDRLERPQIAATLYGATPTNQHRPVPTSPPSWTTSAPCSARPHSTGVAAGAAMELADAVHYARTRSKSPGVSSARRVIATGPPTCSSRPMSSSRKICASLDRPVTSRASNRNAAGLRVHHSQSLGHIEGVDVFVEFAIFPSRQV